jgi:hypothetical protein
VNTTDIIIISAIGVFFLISAVIVTRESFKIYKLIRGETDADKK